MFSMVFYYFTGNQKLILPQSAQIKQNVALTCYSNYHIIALCSTFGLFIQWEECLVLPIIACWEVLIKTKTIIKFISDECCFVSNYLKSTQRTSDNNQQHLSLSRGRFSGTYMHSKKKTNARNTNKCMHTYTHTQYLLTGAAQATVCLTSIPVFLIICG